MCHPIYCVSIDLDYIIVLLIFIFSVLFLLRNRLHHPPSASRLSLRYPSTSKLFYPTPRTTIERVPSCAPRRIWRSASGPICHSYTGTSRSLNIVLTKYQPRSFIRNAPHHPWILQPALHRIGQSQTISSCCCHGVLRLHVALPCFSN